jgi:hypothetical protein
MEARRETIRSRRPGGKKRKQRSEDKRKTGL